MVRPLRPGPCGPDRPRRPPGCDLVAQEHVAEGKFAEAADEFKFVVGKNPKDVDALAKLGIAYASANKFDEAVDAYKRAVALSPKSGELHQRLADVYEKTGKTSEAAKERVEFERLQPNERAKELYKAGKYEELKS